MSVHQVYHNKHSEFWCSINNIPIPIDHILQTSLTLGLGILGEPGTIAITATAFRMLNEAGMQFNPVGCAIEMRIDDPKSGVREYVGVVNSFQHQHNAKQDTVVLAFDKPHWLMLRKVRWWKCFEKTTILDIAEQFFTAFGVKFETPPDRVKNRGVHWENFCIPYNVPALSYILEELSKDNFILFANPQTGGVVCVNWEDINRLDSVCRLFPDFVQDNILAKFDTTSNDWKSEGFTYAKQIDTRLPWKIQQFGGSIDVDLSHVIKHDNVFFTGAKKPFDFTEKDGTDIESNDIGLQEAETYAGKMFETYKIQPYPELKELINQSDNPKIEYDENWKQTASIQIHPRYMYYRMQQSYVNKLKLTRISMVIPGSAKAVVPMSALPVNYYENAIVEDPNTNAEGNNWYSGLFLIWSSKLNIIGPNLMLELELVKPYNVG